MATLHTILFFALMMASVVYGCDNSDTWSHKIFVDENNYTVFMQWKPDKENITIKVIGKTKGWLGMGFSPSGRMAGSDIALGWVANGKGYLQDRHGLPDQNGQPPIDKHQDLELLTSSENETHTTLCFRRKLNTCDEEDFPITNNTMTVIWAMNPQDPSDPEDPSSLKSHGPNNRGVKRQIMLTDFYPKPTTGDIKIWKVQVPNITVPKNRSTLYYCQFFKPPNVTKTHHVVGFEPYIEKENRLIIHHFDIHECTGDNVMEEIKEIPNFNQGFDCSGTEAPKLSTSCKKGFIIWSAGATGDFYPPHVGLPFGIYDGKPLTYMINVHYNNPDMERDIHDSSYIQIYYTDKLRKHDAAISTFGYAKRQPYQIIPPNQDKWKSVAHCAPECLQKTYPVKTFKAFGASLHAHKTTYRIILRHFRNTTELPPIAEDNNTYFRYEQTRFFKDTDISTTDLLTVECTLDTTDRTHITTGGEPVTDEMCRVFLFYYPRSNLTSCFSHLPLAYIGQLTGIQEFYPQNSENDEIKIKEPKILANKTFRNYLQNLQLNETQVKSLEEMELRSDKTPMCMSDDKSTMPKDLQPVNYPTDFSPYTENKNACNNKKQI